jgi:hypothetical protein
VAAMGEGDVEVVDALVCLPERLALLLRHVRAVMLPWEGAQRRALATPRNPPAGASEEAVGIGAPALTGREACGSGAWSGLTMPYGRSCFSSAMTAFSWRWLCGGD